MSHLNEEKIMSKGRYEFQVRSYECGRDGKSTLPTICNFLQEAASINAESLGFSKSDFEAVGENVSWVLTHLLVKMTRYPNWKERVTVETFPRGGRKVVAWRDFTILDESGAVLGVATSEWMLIDLATRKIVAVPEKVLACASAEDVPVLGVEPFSRFKFPADDGKMATPLRFRAQNSQIDLNGHVNNVHYINWMFEPCKGATPSEMEVVFRSETFAGDEVVVEVAEEGEFRYHRVASADGKDHIIARSKN